MATDTQPQTPPIVSEKENFDDAFEKLAEMVESPPAAVAAQPVEKPAEPVADAAPEVKDAPPEDPEDDEAEEVEVPAEEDEDDGEDVEAQPAATSDDEILERFAKIVKEKVVAPEPQRSASSPPQAQPEPVLSPEEMEFLNTYEKDWPDIAKAEMLRRRAEYRDLVGYIFSEVAKELSPMLESVRTVSERTHLQDLQAKVEDYDDVRDKVIDWVGQQPAYLQPAYNHVIQRGTVDEVEDLINRYKADTGYKVATAPTPARKKMETELPTATKQAAASLAPVSSKRSAVVTGIDSGDFDSAFSAFADKL